MISITPLYAGLIALLFLWLSAQVVKQRFKARVSVGDGADAGLIKAMRGQANCAEYAPIGLLLLLLTELQGAPVWVVHMLGAVLLLGRVLHAYGFSADPQITLFRRVGMYLTAGMIATAALANIAHALL